MAAGKLDDGAVIAERYALVETLGEGGFGEVWKARDRKLDREVAIKFMRPQLVSNASLRRRFERESRALAAIKHPNVVQVFDDGEWQGRPFVVLEYIDGGTLRDWLESHRKLRKGTPLDEVRGLFVQVCDGVAAAHAKSIVHRDLKPENVLIEYDSDGRAVAKVLDFGLARVGEGQSSVALQVGTYAYMSPEQAAEGSDAVGATSDVFALGVMLVEMLTGRVLPDEASKAPWERVVATGKAAGALARLRGVRAEVPEGVWAVVERALAGEPTQRYANAGETRRAVEQAWGIGSTRTSGAPVADAWVGRVSAPQSAMPSVVQMPSMAQPRADVEESRRIEPMAGSQAEVPRSGGARPDPEPAAERAPAVSSRRVVLVGGGALATVLAAVGGWIALREPSATPIAATAPIAVRAETAPVTPQPAPVTSQPVEAAPAGSVAAEPSSPVLPSSDPASTPAPELSPLPVPVVETGGQHPGGRHSRHSATVPAPARPLAAEAPTASSGATAPIPEGATPMDQARACLRNNSSNMTVGNQCVVMVLRGRDSTESETGLLAVTYRTMGRTTDMVRTMRRYIQQYPDGPRVASFQQAIDNNQ